MVLNFDASILLENALFEAGFLFNKYPQAESYLMVSIDFLVSLLSILAYATQFSSDWDIISQLFLRSISFH